MRSSGPAGLVVEDWRGASFALHEERPVAVLRLAALRPGSPLFRHVSPASLWRAVHRCGLPIGVRWLVLPPSVVGPPGHVEVSIVVQVPFGAAGAATVDELCTLLSAAHPQLRFEPVSSTEEAHFALHPFGGRPAWSLVLESAGNARPARPLGFAAGHQGPPGPARWSFELNPEGADAAQALFLLVHAPMASQLEWRLTPADLPAGERARIWGPGETESPPLAFHCRLTWTGATGPRSKLLASSLEAALGAADGAFQELRASNGAQTLPLVPHTAVPLLFPSLEAIAAVVPSMAPKVEPRLPARPLPDEGRLLGHAFDGRSVLLSSADRLRHVWVLGQTGTGKSTLLLNQILSDAQAGHGIALFDPHGDLVDAVVRELPPERAPDVVVVDVSGPEADLPSLNLLACSDLREVHTRVGQVLEFICSLWPVEMTGPAFQQAATHAMLLLAARFESPGTLADLSRLFFEERFRRQFLEDPRVAERVPESVTWWKGSFENYSAFTKSETLDYYISKFNHFFTDPVLRRVLGTSQSILDFRKMMDERRVLLCNLGRGAGNPLATTMLSGLFMQAAFNAATTRPPGSRDPFFIYCDEFQRIAGPGTGDMLSEVRKYGVGMVLAHQFVEQIPEQVLAAVIGNVGTRILFRTGARDALKMVGYMPELSVRELTGLPNFTAITEVLAAGAPSGPFTLIPLPPAGA